MYGSKWGKQRWNRSEFHNLSRYTSLSHAAFRLFMRLCTLADDDGNVDIEPDELYPRFMFDEDITALLSELKRAGHLKTYMDNDHAYASIVGWNEDKHANQQTTHSANISGWRNPLPPWQGGPINPTQRAPRTRKEKQDAGEEVTDTRHRRSASKATNRVAKRRETESGTKPGDVQPKSRSGQHGRSSLLDERAQIRHVPVRESTAVPLQGRKAVSEGIDPKPSTGRSLKRREKGSQRATGPSSEAAKRLIGRVRANTAGSPEAMYIQTLKKNHPWRNEILRYWKTKDVKELYALPQVEIEDLYFHNLITDRQRRDLNGG